MESLLNEVCYVQIGLEEKENEIVRIKEEKDQTLLLMKKQEYAFKQVWVYFYFYYILHEIGLGNYINYIPI